MNESLHKVDESIHQEEAVKRKGTHRDRPVRGGNDMDENDSMGDMPSQSISIIDSSRGNLSMVIPEEDEDVKRLAGNISLCIDSICFTKGLIQEYIDFFEKHVEYLGEDGNEITKKHFS